MTPHHPCNHVRELTQRLLLGCHEFDSVSDQSAEVTTSALALMVCEGRMTKPTSPRKTERETWAGEDQLKEVLDLCFGISRAAVIETNG
jgi:hypothetical protein